MSKQQLTIEELAPYLPYGLKCWVKDYAEIGKEPVNNEYTLNAVYSDGSCVFHDLVESSQGFKDVKPILRPMSEVVEYFEEIYGTLEHQDVTDYLDADYLNDYGNLEIEDLENIEPENLTYGTLQVLLKHHFDIFGLIEKGLAININDLK